MIPAPHPQRAYPHATSNNSPPTSHKPQAISHHHTRACALHTSTCHGVFLFRRLACCTQWISGDSQPVHPPTAHHSLRTTHHTQSTIHNQHHPRSHAPQPYPSITIYRSTHHRVVFLGGRLAPPSAAANPSTHPHPPPTCLRTTATSTHLHSHIHPPPCGFFGRLACSTKWSCLQCFCVGHTVVVRQSQQIVSAPD